MSYKWMGAFHNCLTRTRTDAPATGRAPTANLRHDSRFRVNATKPHTAATTATANAVSSTVYGTMGNAW